VLFAAIVADPLTLILSPSGKGEANAVNTKDVSIQIVLCERKQAIAVRRGRCSRDKTRRSKQTGS
jgi:hypothetical protein